VSWHTEIKLIEVICSYLKEAEEKPVSLAAFVVGLAFLALLQGWLLCLGLCALQMC